MSKLRDLDGFLLKVSPTGESYQRLPPTDLKDADGVIFLCPKCFQQNNGPIGTHSIICWFVGRVPDSLTPKPGRWNPSGTCLDDLTFVPGDPPRAISVLMTNPNGCQWHGYIKDGCAD